MRKKIINVAFWVLFALLMGIWLIDFFKVQNEASPIFCIKKKTHKFEDGEVRECLGLGYKVYDYNRESLSEGLQFGPFFIKMKKP